MNDGSGGATARNGPATGWLVEQLPRPLAEDPFIQRFVGIFEEISTTVHDGIDGVGHLLDPGLAPPEFVRWMGGWIRLAVAGGHLVTIRLQGTGGVDEQQLLAFVQREIPADAIVELLVQDRTVETPDAD